MAKPRRAASYEHMTGMYSYLSYGLVIHAPLPLPELTPAGGEADVVIRESTLPTPLPDDFEDGRCFRAKADEAFLAWRDVINVRVCDGRDVIFHPLADLDERWLRQYLLGPVLGVLLHQRGLLVVHASAVEANGHALAFVGWKGFGKSTTAASLHRRGYDLLADDIVALDMTDPEQPLVVPGFPQLKLWPDAVAALGIDPSELALLHPQFEKRAQRVSVDATRSPKPLRALFVLGLGDQHAIEALPSMEAFSAIVQHAYAARFIGKAGIPPSHFHHCIALARTVPVYRFTRQPSLAKLPKALDLLEAHLLEKS